MPAHPQRVDWAATAGVRCMWPAARTSNQQCPMPIAATARKWTLDDG